MVGYIVLNKSKEKVGAVPLCPPSKSAHAHPTPLNLTNIKFIQDEKKEITIKYILKRET